MVTKEKMRTEDPRKIKKVSNDNLNTDEVAKTPIQCTASDYSDQPNGIVKVAQEPLQSEEEFHTVQEQHNANHALYYFSMITDGIIRGRTTGNDCEKVKRIKEHMMNLREYVGQNKAELKTVIRLLFANLEKSCPRQRKEFILFIYENWSLISFFEDCYPHEDSNGPREKCFPETKYQKIRDIVYGRYYFRSWWWKVRADRLRIRLRNLFKRRKK